MMSGSLDQNGSARLLIVEDDEMQARILQAGLVASGFRTDTVSNGADAVERGLDGHYDGVLVDYNMPEISGLATARLLGDFLGRAARPVLIALTATPDRLLAREKGGPSAFDLVLDKTCDLQTIVTAITRCIHLAPDLAARQGARDALYDQAEEDYVMGPLHADAANGSGPPRILVVDDDESQRLFLTNALERRGYRVSTSADGLEAIRNIRENGCDLAIFDYQMPDLDGAAAASLVHDQIAQAWRPRLLALTATPELLHAKAKTNGPMFDQVLGKLDGLHAVLEAVDHLLRSSPNPDTRRAVSRFPPIGIRTESLPA